MMKLHYTIISLFLNLQKGCQVKQSWNVMHMKIGGHYWKDIEVCDAHETWNKLFVR